MRNVVRAVAIVVCVAGVLPARAGIEPRFRIAFAGEETPITYVYELRLVAGRLVPGSSISQHLTMYDIPRLLTGSTSQPPGWTATIQSTGVDADEVPRRGRDDAPRYLNVTWTYTGTATIDASAAPVVLGDFRFMVEQGSTGGRIVSIGQSTSDRGEPVALVTRVIGAGAP